MPLRTKREKTISIWKEILYDSRGEESESRAKARLALMEHWSKHPWNYLTGQDLPDPEREPDWADLGGRPIYWTVDERDDEHPVKPFPYIMDPVGFGYLKPLTEELWRPERIKLIDKARQMYATTLVCGNTDWYCTFKDEREVFLSKIKESDSIKIINDRIRLPHTRKPKWLRDLVGMSDAPQNIITYSNTNSTVTAVAENFGEASARGPTASLIIVDEAAYQPKFKDILRAVMPMAVRVWALTTANIGNEGASTFKALRDHGRPGAREESEDDREEVRGDPEATEAGDLEHDVP